MTNQDTQLDQFKELKSLKVLIDPNVELTKALRGEAFKKTIESYNIPQDVFSRTLIDMTLAVAKLPKTKWDSDVKRNIDIQYDVASIIQAFVASAVSGLSLNPSVADAYLVPHNNAKTNKTELTFMPSYLGLQNKAYEKGYLIDCDYILYNELDFITINKAKNEISTPNLKSRFLMGIPEIPKVDFKEKNINSILENYTWKKYDIAGFYATATNVKTDKIERIETLSIASVMERCMHTKQENWNNITKKYETIERDYKNEILKKHLEKPDNGRRTDAIEILKIRVIRYICKRLPNKDLQAMATMIDEAEGYIDPQESKIKNVSNIILEDDIMEEPKNNSPVVEVEEITQNTPELEL
jgi:hypothetical protein